jgi:predicted O-methyltransferase YrrM
MSEKDLGREIDDYILGLFASRHDENTLFEDVLANMARNDLPSINVSANEGRLLALLTKLSGAKKVLEVGTLGAYSTIWMARALPIDGTILTLEYEPKHARVARENLERAGLSAKVEVRVGSASETLPLIAANGEGPFDLFFIDADKNNYPLYLEWALKLAHSGSVILSDNLIRNGAVINPDPKSADAVAIARYNQELATNPHLESVIVPIIRNNTDGLGISIVK